MKPIHVTPEEALKLANVMGAKIAIPMHWGTFPLGEDSPKTGMRRFLQAPVSGINKLIMKIGETLTLQSLIGSPVRLALIKARSPANLWPKFSFLVLLVH